MKLKNLFLAALLIGLPTSAFAQDKDSPAGRILDRDFKRMMEWFPGVYDNQEQVYFEKNLGVEEELRHGRIHHIFWPVDLPDFPGETFYVQQSQNDDPTDIYRQRIYSFEPDYQENAVRLTIYTPKKPEDLIDAHVDTKKLKGLKPSNMIERPGCEVYWRADAEHFAGYMKPKACSFVSKRSGKTIYVDDDLRLTKNSLWIRDKAEDADGNYVYGNKADVHHKNNKARLFKCWVSPQKEDGSYAFYNDLVIHDQGGRIWVDAVEGEHPRIGLKMRNVVWPMGNNRPSLVLYAYRGDDGDKAVSYTWTSPDGERLAMNLRWVQASCTLGNETIKPGINLKTGSGN